MSLRTAVQSIQFWMGFGIGVYLYSMGCLVAAFIHLWRKK